MDRASIGAMVSLGALLLAAGPTAADETEGIQLTPGLWEFEVSTLMPMDTEEQHQSSRICSSDEVISPETLMPWAEERDCKLKDAKVKGNEMEWRIRCRFAGQLARGKGEFESQGDHAEGQARIRFELSGQPMTMKVGWEGQRLGDCAPPTGDEEGANPKS